jgi:hypothetical protein
VHVVNTKTEALQAVINQFGTTTPSIPTPTPAIATMTTTTTVVADDTKESFSLSASESLRQIGVIDWAKTQDKYINYKALAMAHIREPAQYRRYVHAGRSIISVELLCLLIDLFRCDK